MKRLSILVFAIVVFLMPTTVFGQDATPDATPDVVTITAPGTVINVEQPTNAPPSSDAQLFDLSKALPYLAVILLLVVLVLIEVVDKRRLAELAAKSLTPEMFAIVAAAINKGVQDAGEYVSLTPSPLDDAIYAPTRESINDLLARIRALEEAKSVTPVVQVNNNPPSDSGSNSG